MTASCSAAARPDTRAQPASCARKEDPFPCAAANPDIAAPSDSTVSLCPASVSQVQAVPPSPGNVPVSDSHTALANANAAQADAKCQSAEAQPTGAAPSAKPYKLGERPAPLGLKRVKTARRRLNDKAESRSRAFAWICKFAGSNKVRTGDS